MNKDMRIYIAGHGGMVGSAMQRCLQKAGFTRIVTRSHAALDLTDQRAVHAFFKETPVDYVVLAAARVGGIHANNAFPADFIYQNLMIQTNVIHGAYRAGVRQLLFLGSSCIYPQMAAQPMREEALLGGRLEPTNEPYAIAKIAGIKLCQAYRTQYGRDFISAMPTNLYGPNDNFDLESSHVLPAMIRKFHEAKQRWQDASEKARQNICVTLWGSGTPLREFLFVDDMANACVFTMNRIEAPDLYSKGITHLNIGTGQEISIAELGTLIKDITGFKGNIVYDTTKPDGTPRKLLDVRRMREFGWRYQTELKEGIEKTYQWYVKENQK